MFEFGCTSFRLYVGMCLRHVAGIIDNLYLTKMVCWNVLRHVGSMIDRVYVM